MNGTNSNDIRIRKKDFCALPADQRRFDNGPRVLSVIHGQRVFVPATIID